MGFPMPELQRLSLITSTCNCLTSGYCFLYFVVYESELCFLFVLRATSPQSIREGEGRGLIFKSPWLARWSSLLLLLLLPVLKIFQRLLEVKATKKIFRDRLHPERVIVRISQLLLLSAIMIPTISIFHRLLLQMIVSRKKILL